MRQDVHLYGNPDYTSCFQAAIRMVLHYFEPAQTYSWYDMYRITAKEPGLWTWPMAAMVWLQDHDFDVRCIEVFDYKRVANEGGAYLIEEFGPAIAHEQIAHSNMVAEQIRAREFIAKVHVECRVPSLGDIRVLLDDGYLVHCTVNSRRLNKEEGYAGHSLLVTGYDAKGLFVNDPGTRTREAQKDRYVTDDNFMCCWCDPNDAAKNILAIKKKKQP